LNRFPCHARFTLNAFTLILCNFDNPLLYIQNKRQGATVKKLLRLVNISLQLGVPFTHFVVIKTRMALLAKVGGYTVVAFYTSPLAITVLSHAAVMSAYDSPVTGSTASAGAVPSGVC